jgi:xanthine/CO dehydrogenase XdhC/CoxF family maturation factor
MWERRDGFQGLPRHIRQPLVRNDTSTGQERRTVNPSKLLDFYDDHRRRGESLVLVTVIETRGSTYSKAGAHMLIDDNGNFRGMLSGGCLEGDLAARARAVLESGVPQTVSYNLAEDDELWGMGVGCDGLMRVYLQPLGPDAGYAPFSGIADVLRGGEPREIRIPLEDDGPGELVYVAQPPPRLLVMGGGLDAEPVVRFAALLGWRCSLVDHRPAYIEQGDFQGAESVTCVPAEALGETLRLDDFDLAVVMSHHLESDRTYLRQLASTRIGYIGLLGPAQRRERLLADLGELAAALEPRLHGPAGLAIGGRGPAPIALSIVAQMQQFLGVR